MHVIRLTAENFKRLSAVEIEPDGNVVIVSGRNAQGKSSVLDAIWAALAGKDGAVTRPIRDGETRAKVEVDLGDLIVTRKWVGARSVLEVTARDGVAKYASPQKVLDALIGKLSFDPLAFAQADAKSQVKSLLDVADLGFDPGQVAAERKGAYDLRTEANRRVKRLESTVEGMPKGESVERVDVAALAGELQAVQQAASRREALLAEYERNQAELSRLQARQAELVTEGAPLKAQAERLPGLVAQLEGAQSVNARAEAFERRQELAEDLATERRQSEAFTAEIERLDKVKAEGLAAAELPVDGLSFDEEGVLYQGVPFKQASAAEQLRVSVAMAMSLNPEARVILIRDGSLLDSENMRIIEEMAQARDFQVWIERVDESGQVGVVIEDGAVA